jgi:hypothetical protein
MGRPSGQVSTERRDGRRVERQRPPAGAALGLGDDDLVIHQDAGHPRADPCSGHVDVDSSQASDFAATHAGGGEQHPGGEQAKLVGVTPVLTYITLAEWWQWAHHRGWGPAKISEMRTYASNFELLHCDNEVVKTWGGCPDSP